ncbi:MAG: ribonuclease III domain-containing protein [Promethearchaeota archaeon]
MRETEVKKKLEEFQQFINYKFKNEDLLRQALTTPRLGNESGKSHYEILETLGDPVLKLILSLKIYNEREKDPGGLTKKKQMIENDNTLNEIGDKYFNLKKYIIKSIDQKIEGTTILADIIEAICGALYLDSEFNIFIVEEKIVDKFYNDSDSIIKDSTIFQKNYLLEFLQKIYKITPKIDIEYKKTGPDHNLKWIAKHPKILNLNINLPRDMKSEPFRSKKEAEQDLYLKILHYLKEKKL